MEKLEQECMNYTQIPQVRTIYDHYFKSDFLLIQTHFRPVSTYIFFYVIIIVSAVFLDTVVDRTSLCMYVRFDIFKICYSIFPTYFLSSDIALHDFISSLLSQSWYEFDAC